MADKVNARTNLQFLLVTKLSLEAERGNDEKLYGREQNGPGCYKTKEKSVVFRVDRGRRRIITGKPFSDYILSTTWTMRTKSSPATYRKNWDQTGTGIDFWLV